MQSKIDSREENVIESTVYSYESEDIEEEEIRQTFQKPPLHPFIVFVSSGLPDKFLNAHRDKELLNKDAQDEIQKAITETIYDPVLRKHLKSRLNRIKNFQEERKCKSSDN